MNLKADYYLKTPKNLSVEDLEVSKISELIDSRVPIHNQL